MPRLSQDMETGRVAEWLKQEGDEVREGEPLLVVETDKADVDVEAPASGILRRILVAVGEEAAIGAAVGLIGGADEALPVAPAVPAPEGRRPSSPAARRLAQELGVDIAAVTGRGEGGLITEVDVRAFAGSQATEPTAAPGEVETIPMVGMRRRIAERLALSRQSAADVTTIVDVDMTAIGALRATSGVSYTAYVGWAVAQELPGHRALNATLFEDRIELHRQVNLGVAVSLPEGLVVPVVRHADALSLEELEARIGELAARIRTEGLRPSDTSGGTFTLTNSGAFGSLFFTPIINLPQVAILGMGKVADAALVRGGEVVAGKRLYLCLTYDHRAVDGEPAVRFLAAVKARLESLGT